MVAAASCCYPVPDPPPRLGSAVYCSDCAAASCWRRCVSHTCIGIFVGRKARAERYLKQQSHSIVQCVDAFRQQQVHIYSSGAVKYCLNFPNGQFPVLLGFSNPLTVSCTTGPAWGLNAKKKVAQTQKRKPYWRLFLPHLSMSRCSNIRVTDCSASLQVDSLHAVGLEPTSTNTLRPEHNPLDRSGKRASQDSKESKIICI